jgi:DNA-binding beta-propeller fold protein YncE
MKYELDRDWGKLPDGWIYQDVVGVRADAEDNVFVFNRGTHPMIVFSREGKILRTWGDGVFTRPHGLEIAPDGSIWCVDDGGHCVRKFTPSGELLQTIGTPGTPSDTGWAGSLDELRGGPPFNQPTNCVVAPNGDLYVTDGYRNCKVHRFAPDGTLEQSWGVAGQGPGQFRLVHGICAQPDGTLLVGDRANDRIQLFNPNGDHLGAWPDSRQPCDLFRDRDGLIYVAELGKQDATAGDIGARVSIRDKDGKLVTSWGDQGDPAAPGNICGAHTACTDSRGDVYVGEVTHTARASRGMVPADTHVFQKFRKVA